MSTWKIDPSHSHAQFSVRHMMITNVRGDFPQLSGTVELDEVDVTKSKVEATLATASIDTRDAKRDTHLKSADFFDAEKHPSITFRSTSIKKAGEGELSVTGDLSMHGVTKSVVLKVEGPTPPGKTPWGGIKRGASATTKVSRKEFGLEWNAALETGGVLVGDEIKITLELELDPG